MLPTVDLFGQEGNITTTSAIINVQNTSDSQDVISSDAYSGSAIDKRKSTCSTTSNETTGSQTATCSPRNSTLNPLKTFRFSSTTIFYSFSE